MPYFVFVVFFRSSTYCCIFFLSILMSVSCNFFLLSCFFFDILMVSINCGVFGDFWRYLRRCKLKFCGNFNVLLVVKSENSDFVDFFTFRKFKFLCSLFWSFLIGWTSFKMGREFSKQNGTLMYLNLNCIVIASNDIEEFHTYYNQSSRVEFGSIQYTV